MNKKKILAVILSVLLVMPISAYAKGNENNSVNKEQKVVTESNQGKGATVKVLKEVNKDQKQQEIATFKIELKNKHETMTALRQQTIELKKQIEDEKTKLEGILEDIKSGAKTLPQDQLTLLLAKVSSLKTDAAVVKTTGIINKDAVDAQSKVQSKDFNNALASLDKVIAKFQARLAALQKLKSDLVDIMAIGSLATVPATEQVPEADSAVNPTTTTTTSTDTATTQITN